MWRPSLTTSQKHTNRSNQPLSNVCFLKNPFIADHDVVQHGIKYPFAQLGMAVQVVSMLKFLLTSSLLIEEGQGKEQALRLCKCCWAVLQPQPDPAIQLHGAEHIQMTPTGSHQQWNNRAWMDGRSKREWSSCSASQGIFRACTTSVLPGVPVKQIM